MSGGGRILSVFAFNFGVFFTDVRNDINWNKIEKKTNPFLFQLKKSESKGIPIGECKKSDE